MPVIISDENSLNTLLSQDTKFSSSFTHEEESAEPVFLL